jgi:transposase
MSTARSAARMGRPTRAVVLTGDERRTLRRWSRQSTTSPALAVRARIVLACAEGLSNVEVAARLGVHPTTVGTWRSRFLEWRLEGLGNRPQPGAPRIITDAQVRQVIIATLGSARRTRPYWSAQSLAEQVGMSPSSVSRIWRAFGLEPRLVESWKRATDPWRIEGVREIVGLYLNPPETVLALCAEELSKTPAPDRLQAIPLARPSSSRLRIDSDHPNDAGDLHAALDRAIGMVIPQMTPWRRVLEFQSLLRCVDQVVPAVLGIHLIVDISPTYTAPAIRRWLRSHPRVRLRFTPAYSSWTDLVQAWFTELRAGHAGPATDPLTAELARLVRSWIDSWNQGPRPFVWTRAHR